MLIIILCMSIYLTGIVFHIQGNPPTEKMSASLLWPIQFIKVCIWSINSFLGIILPIYEKTRIYKFMDKNCSM